VALFPSPAILLYSPSIYNITYQIQCIAGVVFKKVVELIGFAISCAQMHIADKD
jgi:hypothetical protein